MVSRAGAAHQHGIAQRGFREKEWTAALVGPPKVKSNMMLAIFLEKSSELPIYPNLVTCATFNN